MADKAMNEEAFAELLESVREGGRILRARGSLRMSTLPRCVNASATARSSSPPSCASAAPQRQDDPKRSRGRWLKEIARSSKECR